MNNTGINVAKITVLGVGGGGNNTINRIHDENIPMVEYVSVHTDDGGFRRAKAEKKIQIGLKTTKGLGSGSSPEVGKSAAEENVNEISEAIKGTDMLFITAGMGGGTGTGAAPVIAEIARALGILTIGVVTKPFVFEGKRKLQTANQGIEELGKYVDSMIVIPNENLHTVIPVNCALKDAFVYVDDVLVNVIKNIIEVVQQTGTINCDFADINTVLKDSGCMHTATGFANGTERVDKVIEQIRENKLLGTDVENASSALLCISSSNTVTLDEIHKITGSITDVANKDINMIFGVNIDESMGENLKVVLISTKKQCV